MVEESALCNEGTTVYCILLGLCFCFETPHNKGALHRPPFLTPPLSPSPPLPLSPSPSLPPFLPSSLALSLSLSLSVFLGCIHIYIYVYIYIYRDIHMYVIMYAFAHDKYMYVCSTCYRQILVLCQSASRLKVPQNFESLK